MKNLIIFILTLLPSMCIAQKFNLSGKHQIKIPNSIKLELYNYIEKNNGINLTNDRFAYVPVYNTLDSSQNNFIDGLYFFKWSAHESGQLFINKNNKISIVDNSSILDALIDYTNFIKNNKISEKTQIAYLGIISSFMQYRYEDQQMLLKSGVIIKKNN